MTETATSPTRLHSTPRASRPSTTPSSRPPLPGSVGQKMPPLLTPRITTPQTSKPSANISSPNYFGHQSGGGDGSFLTDSPQHTKTNWSPPSSAVRSTAAASPSVLPLDQNPEFDAFRRQSEGKAFNLGGMGNDFNLSPQSSRSKHRSSASRSSVAKEMLQSQSLDPATADVTRRSPKRVLSPGSSILPEEARRASPANFTKVDSARSEPARSKESMLDGQPRFALPLDNLQGPAPMPKARAETDPVRNGTESTLMVTPQHVVNLMESRVEQVLLLDLRVSTQYAKSHIFEALNLCIPTTLLKRPSFNVHKLAETFKDDEQRQQFEKWRNSTYIIVYDASSSLLKDAQICVNTVKKFRSEGYGGSLYIVQGGLNEFAKRFPSYIEQGADSKRVDDASQSGVEDDGPEVAPVVGGCPMPSTDKPANPFFGNIRQNMDLIGGVGQIPLKHPQQATKSTEKEFPEWLQQVSDNRDEGKKASNKFEQIERREKKRMEDALSGQVSYGTPRKQAPGNNSTQIAGIEKGTKNRYNNIWPFEHSRVKLQGVPNQGCDYFNGSHIKASWSNKRYITTQAPMPGTFNDFWNVVWQQDIRVVVMLTAEKEGAQVKAHNYWDKKQYGSLHLEFLSEKRASIDPTRIHRSRHRPSAVKRASTGPVPLATLDAKEEKAGEHPYVIVRRFTLSHERHAFEPIREITQLQYSSWPDFGAPANPAHLLGLVEQCDAVVRSTNKTHAGEPEPPNKRPILVHCSAGCGRTGTFCTVDSVIDMLKRQRITQKGRQATPMDVDQPAAKADSFFGSQFVDSNEGIDGTWVQREDQDLVEKTVEDFRHQRLSMVQSLRQYVLCYESVMEWLVEQSQRGS